MCWLDLLFSTTPLLEAPEIGLHVRGWHPEYRHTQGAAKLNEVRDGKAGELSGSSHRVHVVHEELCSQRL